MNFVYTHAFVVPVFVSLRLVRDGVFRYSPEFEPRDLHEVARRALRGVRPPAHHADFPFGGETLRAVDGVEGLEPCIRIGYPDEFDVD